MKITLPITLDEDGDVVLDGLDGCMIKVGDDWVPLTLTQLQRDHGATIVPEPVNAVNEGDVVDVTIRVMVVLNRPSRRQFGSVAGSSTMITVKDFANALDTGRVTLVKSATPPPPEFIEGELYRTLGATSVCMYVLRDGVPTMVGACGGSSIGYGYLPMPREAYVHVKIVDAS